MAKSTLSTANRIKLRMAVKALKSTQDKYPQIGSMIALLIEQLAEVRPMIDKSMEGTAFFAMNNGGDTRVVVLKAGAAFNITNKEISGDITEDDIIFQGATSQLEDILKESGVLDMLSEEDKRKALEFKDKLNNLTEKNGSTNLLDMGKIKGFLTENVLNNIPDAVIVNDKKE